VRFW